MCVQYIGGCSVHRGCSVYGGCSVYRGDTMSTSAAYHEHIGRIPWVHRGISWVHRVMFSTSEYHDTCGEYHEYIGRCSVHWGCQYKSNAFINLLPHMNHDPPDVLNIPPCTQDIPRCTHGVPDVRVVSPDVLNTYYTEWYWELQIISKPIRYETISFLKSFILWKCQELSYSKGHSWHTKSPFFKQL